MLTIPICISRVFKQNLPREHRRSSFVDVLENETHNSLHAVLRFCMFADAIAFALERHRATMTA